MNNKVYYCFKIIGLLSLLGIAGITSLWSSSEPRLQLESTINTVDGLLKDESLSSNDLETKVFTEVEELFSFYHIARRSVGRQWQRFSQQEQTEFVDALSQLLFKTYYRYLVELKEGPGMQVINETILGKRQFEVRTKITIPSGIVPVSYRFIRVNGGWRIYDVIIEGVSMVSNYRSQFLAVLNADSPEELIALIRSKNEL